MISSTACVGGGPLQMVSLGKLIENEFEVFYALPRSNLSFFNLKKENTVYIQERKLSLKDIYNLVKFIQVNSIGILHAHGKGAGLIGRILKFLTKKPLIYSFHGIHIKCHNILIKNLYVFYERYLGLIDDHKIFVSKSESLYAFKNKIIKNKNYSIINNSIGNKNFRKITNNFVNNKEIGIQNNNKNIISVNRLVDQKNVFEVLEIAKHLKKYNFLIIGNGPLEKDLKHKMYKEKINNVYMFGLIKDVFKYLYLSKVFLTTSLYEGLSLSLLEAMSIGLPVVASNVIGNYDAINHNESGFLYELGNVKSACKYIELIMENYTIELKMSARAFKKQREEFCHEIMHKKYLKIYEMCNV